MTTTGRVVPYLTEMFRFQAWVSLGKMTNPVSGEVERNLAAARAAIDMLAELETKTEGNRSPEESRMLQGALTDLRLNYLEEMKKGEEPEAAGGPADEAQGDGPTGFSTGEEAPAGTESKTSEEKE